MFHRGIIAIQRVIHSHTAGHPFIVRKADCRHIAFKLPSESGPTGAKVAMDQVSRLHLVIIRYFGRYRTGGWIRDGVALSVAP